MYILESLFTLGRKKAYILNMIISYEVAQLLPEILTKVLHEPVKRTLLCREQRDFHLKDIIFIPNVRKISKMYVLLSMKLVSKLQSY